MEQMCTGGLHGATPHFDIDGKLDLPARLAQRSRSFIRT